MTIDWQEPDGSDGVALAASGDLVSEFRVNGEPLLQAMPALRADTVKHKGRGNLTTRVSFLVTYATVASAAAALEEIADLTDALKATLQTHELLEGVFGATTWQLAEAALENFELWQSGVTVFGRFSFVGGEFSKVVP